MRIVVAVAVVGLIAERGETSQWSLGLGAAQQSLEGESLLSGLASIEWSEGIWAIRLEVENGESSGVWFTNSTRVLNERFELVATRTSTATRSWSAGIRSHEMLVDEGVFDEVLSRIDTTSLVGGATFRRPWGRVMLHATPMLSIGSADVDEGSGPQSEASLGADLDAGLSFTPGRWTLTPGIRLQQLKAGDVSLSSVGAYFTARLTFGK